MAAEGDRVRLPPDNVRVASMGPRPDGRGRKGVYELEWIYEKASMGPRPDGRGRRYLPPAPGVSRKASMGPRPDGRGRRTRRPRCTIPPSCVNGAATGWPRKDRRPAARGRASLRASMGPRPDGRGRHVAHLRIRDVALASMGPRPDGRGRTAPRPVAPYQGLASMGPRPDGRGRATCGPFHELELPRVNGAATGWPRKGQGRDYEDRPRRRVNGAATGWPRKGLGAIWYRWAPALRQWGRDRMAAEGDVNGRCYDIRLDRRQWGRDRMAAEGSPATPQAPQAPVASMGPRPDGRGRWVEHTSRFWDVGVNGAATGWPRKEGAPRRSRAGRSAASMGPRPDGRGRWGARTHLGGGRRVNGAATGWPRKVLLRSSSTFCDMKRQWGRDRMAAEGPRIRARGAIVAVASMGPRPDGRGRMHAQA